MLPVGTGSAIISENSGLYTASFRVIFKLTARMTVRMPLAKAETEGMSQTPFRPKTGVST